ncbi:hypothetical protein [Kitasatospora sp. NPDC002040]|uniref:hypothetical protein n=1 Tax=Kitasatospora sp. NPDC002040 TaxID=3154661 RepID=UPI003327B608
MRAPVINRFAKLVPLAAVAALTAGLTVIPASTAWACGDGSSPAAPAAPEPQHATDPTTVFIDPKATTLVAGGPKVEFGVQVVNSTGAPYKAISPGIAFWNPDSGKSYEAGEPHPDLAKINVRKSDFTLEVMKDGKWTPLKLRLGCDPSLSADTSLLNAPLADGRGQRYLFRIGLAATSPKEQSGIQLYLSTNRSNGRMTTSSMKITHPAAKPAAPKAAPSTAPAPAAVPAVAPAVVPVTAATPSATPTPTASASATPAQQPAATAELAETGSSTPNTFLFASAAASVVLGATVLTVIRRRNRTQH